MGKCRHKTTSSGKLELDQDVPESAWSGFKHDRSMQCMGCAMGCRSSVGCQGSRAGAKLSDDDCKSTSFRKLFRRDDHKCHQVSILWTSRHHGPPVWQTAQTKLTQVSLCIDLYIEVTTTVPLISQTVKTRQTQVWPDIDFDMQVDTTVN